MALLFPPGSQFFNSNGEPLASGSLTFYDTGTTNEKTIWSDPGLSVEASNPYTLDASGRMAALLFGSGVYTIILKDSTGATVWSRDDVHGWQSPALIELTALPVTDDTYSIGSASYRLAELRAVDLFVGSGRSITSGTATPEAAVTAPAGSLFLRTDGDGDTTVYVKVSGAGNTGWQAIHTDLLTGSATYDAGSLADGAGVTTTVTVTGAALGDFAEASFSLDLQGITVTAYVSASDTVSVRLQNETTGPIDLASGTLRARVRKA